MKFTRKIKTMLCCTALAGMLSFDMLPVHAAMCSHKFWSVVLEADKEYYYEEGGHYKDYGTLYICADCGEERWEDLTYHEYFEYHKFEIYHRENREGWNVMVSQCETPNCGAEDVILLD